ncbi:MAG: MBL fold metallo-hydrolase [Desulfobacterales bacterium]|nr:MBL fold metallo-hydrolase [Desulfobacterales bacterium]
MELPDKLHAFIWTDPSANNCNTYLIDMGPGKRILVDPGHHHLFGHIRDGLSQLSLSSRDIDLVIITHGHPDHMEGVKEFSDTDALIAFPEIEMDFIRSIPPQFVAALGVPDFEPNVLLREGDLKIGDLELKVIHAPGHSPGSICLYWAEEEVLFTGDVAFNEGIGRTDLPGGNGQQLKESIRKISQLEADFLLTGHGEIVSGRENIKKNFKGIEDFWFNYI